MTDIIIAIVIASLGSTGLWGMLSHIIQARSSKNSAQSQMLLGLGHDRICKLAQDYIDRGEITRDEYENLVDYLFIPYKLLGGNGTAEKMINEINKLKIKEVKK